MSVKLPSRLGLLILWSRYCSCGWALAVAFSACEQQYSPSACEFFLSLGLCTVSQPPSSLSNYLFSFSLLQIQTHELFTVNLMGFCMERLSSSSSIQCAIIEQPLFLVSAIEAFFSIRKCPSLVPTNGMMRADVYNQSWYSPMQPSISPDRR